MILEKTARGVNGKLITEKGTGRVFFQVRQTDGTFKKYRLRVNDLNVMIVGDAAALVEYQSDSQDDNIVQEFCGEIKKRTL